MGVLGVDTSCYTTSVAYAADAETVVQKRRILTVAGGARGLMQSDALFQHVRNLPELMTDLRKAVAEWRVEAVCCSCAPRPEPGSYMPVFLAGVCAARSVAESLGVPFYETSHQQGHMRAALLGSGMPDTGDYLAVHLSGGTTELLRVGKGLSIALLGGTADLNAGQLVDRTGVALGLPFPAGPSLETLAARGEARSRIPLSAENTSLHFSGAEAQIMRWIEKSALSPEDIAAEVYSYLSRAVAYLLNVGARETGLDRVLIAGGVASSARFRRLLPERLDRRKCRIKVYWGKPEYSSDNAVGAALIGLERHRNGGV